MKYIVKLNETAIIAIRGDGYTASISKPEILTKDWQTANNTFGKPEFVEEMSGGTGSVNDSMLKIRELALTNKKASLVAIYLIMIGQTLVLLIMYYKRVFMMAFLITIFPLVAMTFAIDKMGDKKAQSFGIWFKEFVVNVVVQIFHATVYAVLINVCVNSFIATNGKDWFFMILSQFFLFQGEKILRSIFEIKSKANTIGDLAESAAIFAAMRKELGKQKNDDITNVASKQDTADVGKGGTTEQNERNRKQYGAPPASNSATNARNEIDSINSDAEENREESSVPAFDSSAAMDKVAQAASKNRLRTGIASGLAKRAVDATGRVVGATYAMSKGNKNGEMFSNMISDSYTGKKIARGLTTPATGALNIAERRISGEILAAKIRSGKEDENLGLDSAALDVLVNNPPPDIDPNQIAEQNGVTIQEVYREAFARMARATSQGGKSKGELAFWNYVRENTKK